MIDESKAKEIVLESKTGESGVKKLNERMVVRFGGSCVGTPEAIKATADWIKREYSKGNQIVALVSSSPTEREETFNFAKAVKPQPSAKYLNVLVEACDLKLVPLLTMALEERGIPVHMVNGKSIMIKPHKTAKGFYEIKIDAQTESIINAIRTFLNKNEVVVAAGFKVIEGDKINTTILKDSNSSAVVLAGLLDADFCLINTSVDGIFQVDPRIVPNTKRIEFLTYLQMRRFAYLGARILSQRCVDLAVSLNVVIRVGLSPALGRSEGGTIISSIKPMAESGLEAGIAIQSNVVRFNISGQSRKFIAVLKDICLIDSAIYPGVGGYIVVAEENVEKVHQRTKRLKNVKIREEKGLASLTLIDWRIIDAAGSVAKIIKALDKIIVTLNTAGESISVLVKKENMEKVASKLAKTFNLVE